MNPRVGGRIIQPPITNFGECTSLLKKWLSARAALLESPKTRPKHYKNGVFWPRFGAEESAKEFFNTLAPSTHFVNKGKLANH
jgi:hypothetical protein